MKRVALILKPPAVFAAVLLTAVASRAAQVSDFTIYQPYVSARALGMGNAFTAVSDDYSALFYNPAGLSRLKESETNLEVRGMIDGGVLKLKDDVTKASDPNAKVSDINAILSSNYGQHFSARLPTIGAYYVRPHWGIAFIPADLSMELGVHQLVGPSLGVVATQDSTIAFGLGTDLDWFDRDEVSVGITFKGVYRAYYNRSFLALDLATNGNLLQATDAQEGMTADADVGLLYTPFPDHKGFFSFMNFFKPTFALAIRNVVDEGFFSNYHLIDPKTTGSPPNLQRRFDAGIALNLPDWWVWHSRLAFDVRDMGYSQWTFKKSTHVGVEFLWKVRSWFQGGWRAGLNQGYLTAGFTGRFAIFQLDLVSYGEDVGPSDAPQQDRRYMVKTSLDW